MEIGNTQKTKTLFRLVNFTERIQVKRWPHTDKTSINQINFKEGFRYGDGNTQTKQALIRSTLKKGFVMEMANF